jgi:UDP-N-acetylmuramate-alanine ligase
MVRALVQRPLTDALARADRVFVAPVDRPERFGARERLDVAAMVAELTARGVPASGPLTPDEIAEQLLLEVEAGDRVVLMSNGSFGGLAAHLAAALAGRGGQP